MFLRADHAGEMPGCFFKLFHALPVRHGVLAAAPAKACVFRVSVRMVRKQLPAYVPHVHQMFSQGAYSGREALTPGMTGVRTRMGRWGKAARASRRFSSIRAFPTPVARS